MSVKKLIKGLEKYYLENFEDIEPKEKTFVRHALLEKLRKQILDDIELSTENIEITDTKNK